MAERQDDSCRRGAGPSATKAMLAEHNTTSIEPKLWISAPMIGVNRPTPPAITARALIIHAEGRHQLQTAIVGRPQARGLPQTQHKSCCHFGKKAVCREGLADKLFLRLRKSTAVRRRITKPGRLQQLGRALSLSGFFCGWKGRAGRILPYRAVRYHSSSLAMGPTPLSADGARADGAPAKAITHPMPSANAEGISLPLCSPSDKAGEDAYDAAFIVFE